MPLSFLSLIVAAFVRWSEILQNVKKAANVYAACDACCQDKEIALLVWSREEFLEKSFFESGFALYIFRRHSTQ